MFVQSPRTISSLKPQINRLRRLFVHLSIFLAMCLGFSFNSALADILYIGKKDGTIDMIDTATNKTVANLSTGFAPIDSDLNIAISPSGNKLYASTISRHVPK